MTGSSQLIDFIIGEQNFRKMAEAESNNIDATNNPNSIEAGDEDDRKLFVGGLPQDATQVTILHLVWVGCGGKVGQNLLWPSNIVFYSHLSCLQP